VFVFADPVLTTSIGDVIKYFILHKIGKLDKYLMPFSNKQEFEKGSLGVSMCSATAFYWIF